MSNCQVNNGYYSTVSGFEHADSQRTHIFPCSDTKKIQLLQKGVKFNVKIDKIYGQNKDILYGGWNCITRSTNELYILGGCNGRDKTDQAYIQQIIIGNNQIMKPGKKLNLGNSDSSYWNYPGSLVAHQNGYLYVIFGYQLAKINPYTMKKVEQIDLPTETTVKNTCYNGVLILDNGDLAMKNLYRKNGCTEDGALAFFKCDQEKTAKSNVVIVSPGDSLPNPSSIPSPSISPSISPSSSSMKIVAQTTSDTTLGGRLTATLNENGIYYLFSSTEDNVYRYDYDTSNPDNFSQNSDWVLKNYRKGKNETTASAFSIMGDYIVAQTNAIPTAKAPMQIIVINRYDSSKYWKYTPFNIKFSGSFAAVTVLNENNRNYIYCYDALAKRIAAYEFFPAQKGDDAFVRLWLVKQPTTTFLSVIGAPGKRVMVHTEILDSFPYALIILLSLVLSITFMITLYKMIQQKNDLTNTITSGVSGGLLFIIFMIALIRYSLIQKNPYLGLYGSSYSQEKMYWRDLKTGKQLAVSEPFDSGAGMEISPGFNSSLFYPSIKNTVFRFRLEYNN